MIEFLSACLGAYVGACLGVIGAYMYFYEKLVEDVKKQYDADIRIKFYED